MLSSAKQQREITAVAALATTGAYDCKSLKFSVFNSEASARTSPVVAYFTNIEECKQGGIIAKNISSNVFVVVSKTQWISSL